MSGANDIDRELEASSAVKLTDGEEAQFSQIGQKVTGEYAQHVIAEIGGASGTRKLFFEHATVEGGTSIDMNVNGSLANPEVFTIPAQATESLVVQHLNFEIFDGGIKMDNFLGQNSELNNGILIEVKSQDEVFTFKPIVNTQEFDSHFAFGSGRSFELIIASGTDSLVARFGLNTPLVIKPQGTYATDDYIKVFIRDNLNSVDKIQFLAEGSVI